MKTENTKDIYQLARLTPLEFAPKISKRYQAKVYMKREDLQPINSFKIRGAFYKMLNLSLKEKKLGVITASAGNHAQGVALSAKALGIEAKIVMPKTTPEIKINAVKSHGAEIVLFGDNYSEAEEYCIKLQKSSNKILIHPFDDLDVINGQGTIGIEIMNQLPDVTHVFIPVGGGGLISGMSRAIKKNNPNVKIIAVEPKDSNVMQLSLMKNERIKLEHVGIFADGVAVKQLGKNTFKIAKKYVDQCISVSNDQICAAIKEIFEENRTIVEPAGALSLAGLAMMNQPSMKAVIINSGSNIQFERLQYIAERTLIGSGKEAIFSVEIPELPGALNAFCESVINGLNITQLAYRFNLTKKANILIGLGLSNSSQVNDVSIAMKKSGYTFINLTEDEVTKEHVRYMIGGSSSTSSNEHFYQIKFPERPGALYQFLQKVSSKFNISSFHYRGQGSDSGLVLIGFQSNDRQGLEDYLNISGLDWENYNQNRAIKTFLQ